MRSIAYLVLLMVLLGFLAWVIKLLDGEPDWLGWIAIGLVSIIGSSVLLHGVENVAARLDFNIGRSGVSGSIDSRRDAPPSEEPPA
jgi:peptidoglycan/LPS O-acetylase OafA/YrhL